MRDHHSVEINDRSQGTRERDEKSQGRIQIYERSQGSRES